MSHGTALLREGHRLWVGLLKSGAVGFPFRVWGIRV